MMYVASWLESSAVFSTGWIIGQSGPGNTTWLDLVREIDNGKLVLLLVFGAGIVSAAGYALAGVIRAMNASPEDAEELHEQLAALEKRVELLERK